MVAETFKHMMMRRLDFLNRTVCICSFSFFLFFPASTRFRWCPLIKKFVVTFLWSAFLRACWCSWGFYLSCCFVLVRKKKQTNKWWKRTSNVRWCAGWFLKCVVCICSKGSTCLDFFKSFLSCQSSADDSHEMSRLFSEKNNKSKIVFYCSCDWRSKG